ncbi:DUF6030 family protein [Rhizobium paknamense]|uniref:Exopolysaccharide biosynthesis protein n=1 Tax=Rhizobium paknamense TaxID=1206817 RepID=A0ABU0IFE4_9HYPH|nr:DUF6030 family protein [Rhizobium paknamense]MDQ0456973.1 hypothetical protein [Rhizobium paknamense]
MLPDAGQPKPGPGDPRSDRGSRRGGRVVFVALLLVMLLGLTLTVLLANDQRHLKALLAYLPLSFSAPQVEDEPVALRGRRLPPLSVRVPAGIFKPPPLLERAVFLRRFRLRGADFCADMQAVGLANGGWNRSAFEQGAFECISEKTEAAPRPDADPPSFFMVVRGDSSGQIVQIRLKIVEPGESGEVRRRFDAALDLMLKKTGWLDFADTVARMRRLDPVEVNHFGIGFKMTKEFMGPHRYNISMMLEDDGELDRRTRAILQARPTLAPPHRETSLWPLRP